MRIGDLAAATGASARSLRYYEEQGLLASVRSPGGQRGYPPAAVERVGLIRSLLAAGLTSAAIRDVLPCVADESIRTPWLADRLGDELTRVESQIAGLSRTRDVLAALIEDYRVSGLEESDDRVSGLAKNDDRVIGTEGTVPSATRR